MTRLSEPDKRFCPAICYLRPHRIPKHKSKDPRLTNRCVWVSSLWRLFSEPSEGKKYSKKRKWYWYICTEIQPCGWCWEALPWFLHACSDSSQWSRYLFENRCRKGQKGNRDRVVDAHCIPWRRCCSCEASKNSTLRRHSPHSMWGWWFSIESSFPLPGLSDIRAMLQRWARDRACFLTCFGEILLNLLSSVPTWFFCQKFRCSSSKGRIFDFSLRTERSNPESFFSTRPKTTVPGVCENWNLFLFQRQWLGLFAKAWIRSVRIAKWKK